MIDRLIHKADFESLMAAPAWSRSAHFVLHHLGRSPNGPLAAAQGGASRDLSTPLARHIKTPVDKQVDRIWIGAVLPKRLARRAVTRNLLKRQIRAAFRRREADLPRGLWLVRLRRPFASAEFASARSPRLAVATRLELEGLLRPAPAATAATSATAAGPRRARR